MRCLRIVMFVMFFIGGGSSILLAQELAVPEAIQEGEEVQEKSIVVSSGEWYSSDDKDFAAKVAAAKRFELQQLFAVEIEGIHAACELDEKQRKKLAVGVKLGIAKVLKKWGLKPAANLDNTETEDGAVEKGNELEATGKEKKIVFTDFHEIEADIRETIFSPTMDEMPTERLFWRKVVDETLTEDQKKSLQEKRLSQAEEARKALLTSFVVAVSRQLSLTRDQEKQLRELVRPLIGRTENPWPVTFELMFAYSESSKVDEEKLEAILSSPQLQQWKFMMARAAEFTKEGMEADIEFGE